MKKKERRLLKNKSPVKATYTPHMATDLKKTIKAAKIVEAFI